MQFYILIAVLAGALVDAKTTYIYVLTGDLASVSNLGSSQCVVAHWGALFSPHGPNSQHWKQALTNSSGTLFEVSSGQTKRMDLTISDPFQRKPEDGWRFKYYSGMTFESVSIKDLEAMGKVVLWFR